MRVVIGASTEKRRNCACLSVLDKVLFLAAEYRHFNITSLLLMLQDILELSWCVYNELEA